VTASQDFKLKVWDDMLRLIGSVDVNHPLPVQWEVVINEREVLKHKVEFALKVANVVSSQLPFKMGKTLDPYQILSAYSNTFITQEPDRS
jgi:hypothetical protein